MKYIFYTLLGALVIVVPMLAFKSTQNVNDTCQLLVHSLNAENNSLSTSQILVVKSIGGFKAEITACQLERKRWKRVLTTSFPAVIGKGGLASTGEKKEGDLKTPAGLYRLGEAFGSQPLALKMDYKYITPDDKFIDDVTSPHYNTWVSGNTDAKSYEPMLIEPYKIGVVINYNMNPTIVGSGSAIFMHLWRSLDAPTHGCIAMDEQHLLSILYWLDKKQHPYVYITT